MVEGRPGLHRLPDHVQQHEHLWLFCSNPLGDARKSPRFGCQMRDRRRRLRQPVLDGQLGAQLEGATTRLSLRDVQGQVLMQSDGQSPDNRDDQIVGGCRLDGAAGDFYLRQQLLIDSRFVVKAFEMGFRDQLDEVAVAFLVLAQQHQVVVAVGIAAGFVALLGDVDFATDDGVDAGGLRGKRGRTASVFPTLAEIIKTEQNASRSSWDLKNM